MAIYSFHFQDMEALTEFIDTCLDIEISNARAELDKNTTERKAIQSKIHDLVGLRIRMRLNRGETVSSDSSNEEPEKLPKKTSKATPRKKYHPPCFSTCSSSSDEIPRKPPIRFSSDSEPETIRRPPPRLSSDFSSSDSLSEPPKTMGMQLPPFPGIQTLPPNLESGSDPEIPIPLIPPYL